MIDFRTSLVATAVTLGCFCAVTIKAVRAPGPPLPKHSATVLERAEVAEDIAGNERDWMRETAQNFPSDQWSQRDDFHGREWRRASDLAKAKNVPVEDVLRAIDDDIHRSRARGPDATDNRNARAIPCKPRPFYD